jgi:hypothetical protein
MKFSCACGMTLRDQADFLPHKAHFVADQDLFDLYDELETHVAHLASRVAGARGEGAERTKAEEACLASLFASFEAYHRAMYQCPSCGRVYVDDQGHKLHRFDVDDPAPRRDLLGSIRREQWRRPLTARWIPRDDRGELTWQASGGARADDEGFEEFTTWEALVSRYHEVLGRLRDEGTLRHAVLRRGDEIVHAWPPAGKVEDPAPG